MPWFIKKIIESLRGLNIRLRWKLFIILLIFSLTPLIVITIISQRGTLLLGEKVSADARSRLTHIVGLELRQTAENSANVLRRTKDALDFYLQVLASEAERAFSEKPPQVFEVYFAGHFEDPRTAPKDFLPSDKYKIKTHDGGYLDNTVSFAHPVFILAPGTNSSDVSHEVASLTRMIPALRKLTAEFGKTLFRAYVYLQSGVYMSYPGHGGYLESFDPRQLSWQRNAKDTTTWSLPQIDDTTGFLTYTISKRIYRSDGTFLGTVAIDILFIEVLRKGALSPLWSLEAKSFVAAPAANVQSGQEQLQILAQKDYTQQPGSWIPIIETVLLSSGDPAGLEVLINDLKIKKSGYTFLPFQGAESIWAYAAIDEHTFFVVTLPKSVIMELPERTSQSFIEYVKEQILLAGATAFTTLVLLAGAALLGSLIITRSLLRIAEAAKKLSSGDFSVRLGMRTGDERDQLIQAFNDMGPKLEDHLRMHKSLDLAMKVQQKLLPGTHPEVAGLDVAGKSIYCDETGGDYYDYLNMQRDNAKKLTAVIGDVSGHGISSALLMASARAFLRQRIALPGSPAQIISDINQQLERDISESNNFLTLFFLTIDAANNSLRWVRAGHTPGILYDPESDSFEALMGEGIPLGVETSWEYQENLRENLLPGQIILLSTDGLWEQRNSQGEVFGKDNIYALLKTYSSQSANGILNALIEALREFKAEMKLEDDVTLVVIKIVEQK
jgi:sigma-B regulation protein RsbU (phosphoserine phosphatase)